MNLKPFNLEEAKKNPERVVTRDGRKARILCDDLKTKTKHKIASVIADIDGTDQFFLHRASGKIRTDEEASQYDLMLLPVKKEGWVRVFKTSYGPPVRALVSEGVFKTKEEAESTESKSFVAAAKIEWEE